MVCVLTVVGLLSGAQAAQAQNVNGHGTDLLVTVAARSCPTYEDITANLARNDIQESLRDLGPNTLYTSGEPINPAKEDQGQPACTPLRDWRFTFGRGIGGTIKGTWGSLSYVSSPDGTNVVTKPNTPALDEQGRPVPGGAIAGAVTVELSQEQANAAASHNLWIQGGAVDDPVLDKVYPGTYGFGALRCAVDNLNGDNVEFVQIPSGSRHVFCYAYYVVPPPSSGTIVIRKTIKGAPDANESFVMAGNISYDPSGTFTLAGGQSQTFFRAETRPGEAPWTVTERVPDGWALAILKCTHPGASVVTSSRTTGRADITLANGDTVTCTYTNVLQPTDGLLLLRKISLGGVGTFPITASGAGGFSRTREIKTTTAEVAKASKPIKADPGSYRISEDLPRGWRLEKVVCNGRAGTTATVTKARGAVCTVTNRKRQIGRLAVREISQGGTGTAGFTITEAQVRALEPPRRYEKQARTRQENQAREATGDATTGIPFAGYVITQSLVASDQEGTWSLVSVVCDGKPVPFAAGRALVRVTRDNPQVTCTFTNRLTKGVVPPPPEPPVVPGTQLPNLVVTKHANRTRASVGDVVSYDLVARNDGESTVEQAFLADQPGNGGQIVSADPSQGSCRVRNTGVICRLGQLAPGARATVHVRMRITALGRVRNFAAIGSASQETRLRDNLAVAAAVRVQPGPGACSASTRPRAHAAC